MFNIPTDIYQKSYTGYAPGTSAYMPQWLSDLSKPQQPVSEQFAPAYGKVTNAFSKAQAGLPALYKQQLQPASQGVLNQLTSKGMLNSSVAPETMANMMRNLQGDIAGYSNQLAGQEAGLLSNLAGAEAVQTGTAAAQQQNLLANLVGNVGQYSYSEHPLQPYELFSGLLTKLMGY